MFGTKVEEMPPNMTEALAGPALVTAAFVLIALHFMPLGPLAPDGPQKVWGNRTFLNMMEQSNLFLSALWLHAIWVSPDVATQLGAIYLCLRALYPVVWAVWGGPNPSSYTWLLFGTKFNIFYVTFPQYGIVFYMALAAVLKLGMAVDLNALVVAPVVVAPLGCGLFLYHFVLGGFPLLHERLKPLFAKPK